MTHFKKGTPWMLPGAAAGAACLAYSFGAHALGWFFDSKVDKLVNLALFWPVFCLAVWALLLLGQKMLSIPLSARWRAMVLLLAGLATIGLGVFYHLPAYPGNHRLEIKAAGEKNSLSGGYDVEIRGISELPAPGSAPQSLMDGGAALGENWSREGSILYASSRSTGSLSYGLNMKAGALLALRTTPHSGILAVTWDGKSQAVDLYSPVDGERTLALATSPSWRSLSLSWKLLTGSLAFIDLGAAFCLAWLLFSMGAVLLEYPHYARAVGAAAGPAFILLVVGVAANLLLFSRIEGAEYHRIQRLPSNSMLDLDRSSADNGYLNLELESVLWSRYAGSTLVAKPGTLEQLGLDPNELISMGRLGRIESRDYAVELSSAELESLSKLEPVGLQKNARLSHNYIVISTPGTAGAPVCLKQSGDWTYFVPEALMHSCGGVQ
jgi:hypothetical protein